MRVIQFTFLPYIILKEPHKIGDVTFWPYHSHKSEYLKEIPEAISHLDKVAACFKGNYEKASLEHIVAATFDENPKCGRDFPEQQEKIADAVNLFAYIGVTRQSNYSRLFYDNYTPQFFNRDLDAETATISFNSRAGSNAMEIEKAWILNPYHIFIQEADTSYDKDLSEAINNLYNKAYNNSQDEQEEARRLIHAISWFNISKYSDPLISDQIMHTALAVALEALLGIPNIPRKAEALSHSIQLLCGQNDKIDKWSRDFYELRNRILHGAKIPHVRYGENNSHVVLAQIVFDHCLRTKLYLMKLWPMSPISPLFHLKNLEYYLGDNKERLNKILKFKYVDLKEEKNSSSFMKLVFSINDDTDPSGDVLLFKKTMCHIVSLIDAGLDDLKKEKDKYIQQIPGIVQDITDLKSILLKIQKGGFEEINNLRAFDGGTFSGGEEPQWHLQIKHLRIANESIQITYLYILLNDIYRLYEDKVQHERFG